MDFLQRVRARRRVRNAGQWCMGNVIAQNRNGTYHVTFDDGDFEDEISECRPCFVKGQEVRVQHGTSLRVCKCLEETKVDEWHVEYCDENDSNLDEIMHGLHSFDFDKKLVSVAGKRFEFSY